METLLFVPASQPQPPVLPPPLPAIIPPLIPLWYGNDSSLVEIKLTSGTLFEIKEVRFFNAKDVQRLAVLKADAQQKLGGVSAGLIPWGSVSWVIMSSFAINQLESVLSKNSAKQGMVVAQEYMKAEKKLRGEGVFFPIGMIDGIDRAIPARWNIPEQPCYPDGFILDGDEFVVVKDREGIVHSIRWSAVEYFNYHPNSSAAPSIPPPVPALTGPPSPVEGTAPCVPG